MHFLKKAKTFLTFFISLALSFCLAGCSAGLSGSDVSGPAGSASAVSEYSTTVHYPEKETQTGSSDTALSSDDENTAAGTGIDPELDNAVQERLSVQYITPNEYSRPGDALTEVHNIVVHYLANPGTTAQENRDYFDSLAYSGEEYASTHFVIGLEGEIIQLIPLDEISYCSNDRNSDTVAIECCHPDESGVFTDATYDSLVLLTAWLCEYFDLNYTDVIRHYDVTGKICPRAFVENADYYYSFKTDVANTMGEDITLEEVTAASDDSFMDPEEVVRSFAEENGEDSSWPGPPGSRGGGPDIGFGRPFDDGFEGPPD